MWDYVRLCEIMLDYVKFLPFLDVSWCFVEMQRLKTCTELRKPSGCRRLQHMLRGVNQRLHLRGTSWTRPVGCQKRHCQPHVHQVGSVGLLLDLAKTLSYVSILYQSQPDTWFHFTRHLKFERFWNQRPFSHPSGNGFCHRHACLRTKTSSGRWHAPPAVPVIGCSRQVSKRKKHQSSLKRKQKL